MADEKPQPAKPIMDVAHPGRSAPSTNSKSVIITRRPVAQDPMMRDDAAPAETPTPAQAPSNAVGKKIIQPLTAPLVTSGKAVSKTEEPKGETAAIEAAGPEAVVPPQTVATPEASSPADKPDGNKVNEDPQTPAIAKPDSDKGDEGGISPEAVVDAAEAERQAADTALQKLVDSKQYMLPIQTAEKRRTKKTLVIGIVLSLILIAAWLDIALDSGLVHLNGVHPLTHFFSS